MKTLFEVPLEKVLETYSDYLLDICQYCGKPLVGNIEDAEYWKHMLRNGAHQEKIIMICGLCGGKNVIHVMWKPFFKA